jgi:ATP-binding cassette subfamily F protein 3
MTLVLLQDIHVAFGAQDVLTGLALDLRAGARLGLVGANGTGKTTLLKVVAGEHLPDQGTVTRARGLAIRMLRQERQFGLVEATGDAVMEVALRARPALQEMEARLADLHHLVAQAPHDTRALEELGTLRDRYEHAGGYRNRSDVEGVLSGLGLGREKWDMPAASLSGGEAGRLELACILLSEPDLLLLDEPTNHLDMEGVEFLQEWLASFRGAAVLCSHDRWFLDQAATHVAELVGGRLEVYTGGYGAYTVEREFRQAQQWKAFEQQQELIAKTRAWIDAHIASASTASRARSRRAMLDRLKVLQAPVRGHTAPSLMFPMGMRTSELVVAGQGLTHGFGARTLFRDANLEVRRGEKIGVAGPNGSGKSTLARVLAGRITPRSGEVTYGLKVQMLYFDQAQADLPAKGTPFSLVQDAYPRATVESLRTHLGRFHFSGQEADKDVTNLSGGERARLALALETLKPANFLVLDEPTNHLDIPSREALEEALCGYEGTVLLVSHDRYLLDAVTTRTWLVQDGKVEDEVGCFSEARARVRARLAGSPVAGAGRETSAETPAQAHKRLEKERRAVERQLERVEQRVHQAEARITELDALLASPGTPWQALAEAQKERAALAREVEGLVVDWERLGITLDGMQPAENP